MLSSKGFVCLQEYASIGAIGVCKEGLENISSLAGSNVNYVNIFSTKNKEKEKSIIEEIKKYVELIGYGVIWKNINQ